MSGTETDPEVQLDFPFLELPIFNTLWHEQNDHRYTDVIFKYISMRDCYLISIHSSLKFAP